MKKYFRRQLTADYARCVSADKTVLISNQGKSTTCFSPYGDIKVQDLIDIARGEERLAARKITEKCPRPCLLPCFCDMNDEY
jgi:hypothetical protein